MKKLLVVLMALAFVAPAMADDTLDVSGEYRLEYQKIENNSYSNADASQPDYWDQRFRMQLKVKPADGVQAVLRGDFVETTWGSFESRPAGGHTTIMIDKAYVSIDKGMVNLTAGLQGYTLGDSFGYCNQDTGLRVTIKTQPVTIKLGFVKEDENTSLDDETDAAEDENHYYIDLGMKNDALAANVYYAMQQDNTNAENEPNMFGALVKTKVSMLNIKAFLEVFGGSNSASSDVTGIQFYSDVNAKLSDTLKVGADVVYSTGENDANEAKMIRFTNANSKYRTYADRGPLNATLNIAPTASTTNDIMDIGSTGGNSAGAIGIRPYVEFKAMPELTVSANIGYFQAEEDIDYIDSAITYSVWATWAMAPKTTLSLQYLAWNPDEDGDYSGTLEDYSAIAAIMKVKF